MKPKRIQRKRTKGWRMPEGAVFVGRPTKWGNPFAVGRRITILDIEGKPHSLLCDRALSLELYKRYIWEKPVKWLNELRSELRGKDLSCWCSLDEDCHADFLLELAND